MTLGPDDWQALALTLRLAGVVTGLLLLICAPLGWWLARTRCRLAGPLEAILSLPMVLPPTVLGYYLLVLMAPQGALGRLFTAAGGAPPAFTFTGLVIGSVVYSMPFVLQPVRNSFAALEPEALEAAACLRAAPLDRFFTVAIPIAFPGLLTAAILGFAHTLGEFGVVLMLGGSIPGETRVVSIALYDHVEAMNYGAANALALRLLGMSFAMLLAVNALKPRPARRSA